MGDISDGAASGVSKTSWASRVSLSNISLPSDTPADRKREFKAMQERRRVMKEKARLLEEQLKNAQEIYDFSEKDRVDGEFVTEDRCMGKDNTFGKGGKKM